MEARKPRIVRPYVFPAVRSPLRAMNPALPALAPGYAPSPAGLTLYAVEASALATDEALMLAWAGAAVRVPAAATARQCAGRGDLPGRLAAGDQRPRRLAARGGIQHLAVPHRP
ncbi:hypothetical protein G6F50_014722 [Rhizopus delemar]|uniref:Uncharacterized protein n=1 Tax=Rhizopus delemar TaxID=936053 RepID=A0A9P7C6M1_9FUNG|nr:hypothetical protein G6F50_014722 [Rhizopus delemar]